MGFVLQPHFLATRLSSGVFLFISYYSRIIYEWQTDQFTYRNCIRGSGVRCLNWSRSSTTSCLWYTQAAKPLVWMCGPVWYWILKYAISTSISWRGSNILQYLTCTCMSLKITTFSCLCQSYWHSLQVWSIGFSNNSDIIYTRKLLDGAVKPV